MGLLGRGRGDAPPAVGGRWPRTAGALPVLRAVGVRDVVDVRWDGGWD